MSQPSAQARIVIDAGDGVSGSLLEVVDRLTVAQLIDLHENLILALGVATGRLWQHQVRTPHVWFNDSGAIGAHDSIQTPV